MADKRGMLSFAACFVGQRTHQLCQGEGCRQPPCWVITRTVGQENNRGYRLCHRHAIENFAEYFGNAVVEMEVEHGHQDP